MLKVVILSLVSSLATILTLFLFHLLFGSRKPMKFIGVGDDDKPDITVVITKSLSQEKNIKSALAQQSEFIYKKNIKIKFSRELKNIITQKEGMKLLNSFLNIKQTNIENS